MRELSLVRLVDATSVEPEVLQAVSPCLLSTKPDFVIARLILAGGPCYIFKGYLLRILSPPVRKYCIRRYCVLAHQVGGDTELPVFAVLQKTH
jgi:hypothetical protein